MPPYSDATAISALPGGGALTSASPVRLGSRLHFLDAVRGVLASTVVAYHVDVAFGGTALNVVGRACVMIFFAMSGYVLARAYDGRPAVFMARRLVRLWPVYAVVLTLGYATASQFVPWRVLFWLPPFPRVEVDPPAWSLYWEAWATFFFPAAFWVARRSRALAMALAGASFGLTFLHPDLVYVMFFALGVAGSEFAIPWPQRMPGWSLWLGKISYSLYLTHAVVMRVAFSLGGPWAVAASVPAVFAAAWLIWWAVERPSIKWSRRVSW